VAPIALYPLVLETLVLVLDFVMVRTDFMPYCFEWLIDFSNQKALKLANARLVQITCADLY
jgi:hypothetical protein